MTYLSIPHECALPYTSTDGAIWRCDDKNCGNVWRASCPGNPNYAGWRKLGRFGRWLHGVDGEKP